MSNSNYIWSNSFPYDSPRDQQSNAINYVLEEFKKGNKYAIIDCGTGVGKSAIGLTIADHINKNSSNYPGIYTDGAYFLTTQKVLQDQYENDFSKNGLISLYSSSNYTCSIDKSLCKDIQNRVKSKVFT